MRPSHDEESRRFFASARSISWIMGRCFGCRVVHVTLRGMDDVGRQLPPPERGCLSHERSSQLTLHNHTYLTDAHLTGISSLRRHRP